MLPIYYYELTESTTLYRRFLDGYLVVEYLFVALVHILLYFGSVIVFGYSSNLTFPRRTNNCQSWAPTSWKV